MGCFLVLRFNSSAVFLLTQLRTALLRALAREPELNQTGLKNMVWALSRLERVSCMFYHLRRAQRLDVKLRQLAAKADGSQLAKLHNLMAAIVGEAEEEDSQESTLGLSKTSSRQSLVAA